MYFVDSPFINFLSSLRSERIAVQEVCCSYKLPDESMSVLFDSQIKFPTPTSEESESL